LIASVERGRAIPANSLPLWGQKEAKGFESSRKAAESVKKKQKVNQGFDFRSLRPFANGQSASEVSGRTTGETLSSLTGLHPDHCKNLFSAEGKLGPIVDARLRFGNPATAPAPFAVLHWIGR
jgi:hypothetical protein